MPLILDAFERTARARGNTPALRYKQNGRWQSINWPEYREQVRLAGRALLALGMKPHALQMRFDSIVAAVAEGHVDAGLIIHESRFTYEAEDLVSVIDLGDWWEEQTGMPIPLGAILVRDDVPEDEARAVDDAIRRSLAFARGDEDAVMPFVREHAFEMDDDVMRRHIGLYVNEFSDDLGEEGIAAVVELFARARAAGIIPEGSQPRFVSE